ncbi:hypothetical protein ADJ79_01045 [Ottowia sp. oral taxon 894]|nr:hypothetical protein ADJ79_01045 [Ottowia sp. oral taxon 894]
MALVFHDFKKQGALPAALAQDGTSALMLVRPSLIKRPVLLFPPRKASGADSANHVPQTWAQWPRPDASA